MIRYVGLDVHKHFLEVCMAADPIGVAVNIGAAVKHWSTVRRLERGETLELKPWSFGIVVAGLMGIIGLLMASYLTFGLHR